MIKTLAKHKNHVGFQESLMSSAIYCGVSISHRERVVIRYYAASHRDCVKRQRGPLDEIAKFASRVRPPDACARDHYRPFRGSQDRKRVADLVGIRLWFCGL